MPGSKYGITAAGRKKKPTEYCIRCDEPLSAKNETGFCLACSSARNASKKMNPGGHAEMMKRHRMFQAALDNGFTIREVFMACREKGGLERMAQK